MTITYTPVGDNPAAPFATEYSYIPDQLIAGHHNLVTQPIMLAGNAPLPRGAVLGQQTSYTIATAPKAGGNTGNGTLTNVAPAAGVEYSGSALPGYVLTATSATQFTVTDPEGNAVTGSPAVVGTPFTSGEIDFTLTAGSTAFVAGDSFTITATPGIGTFVLCVKTATDGSQVPSAILVDSADPTSGPVRTGAYVSGEFNLRAISYDSSWTVPALLVTALRAFGIHLKSAISAADPS